MGNGVQYKTYCSESKLCSYIVQQKIDMSTFMEDHRSAQKLSNMQENRTECSMNKKYGLKQHNSGILKVFIHLGQLVVGVNQHGFDEIQVRHSKLDS